MEAVEHQDLVRLEFSSDMINKTRSKTEQTKLSNPSLKSSLVTSSTKWL